MSKPMVIVIPMAGRGSRFADAGWTVPKPLIEFRGKMMIEHVLDAFPASPDSRFVLIVRDDFLRDYPECMDRLRNRGNVEFAPAKKVTQGAACSVLLARRFFRNASLLAADSDTFYKPGVLKRFFEEIERCDPDLGLMTFRSTRPCYSYAKLAGGGTFGRLEQIAEKQVISEHAVSGVYYFKSAGAFEDAAVGAMIYGDKDRGEFYLSGVFGAAAKQSAASVLLHEIDPGEMFCTGTPEQLKEAEERLSE